MKNKTKLNIYNRAKEICQKIQKAIDDEAWVVLCDMNRITYIKNKPKFVFDDIEHSINYLEEENLYVEIIAGDSFEDSFKTVFDMEYWFSMEFSFVNVNDVKDFTDL